METKKKARKSGRDVVVNSFTNAIAGMQGEKDQRCLLHVQNKIKSYLDRQTDRQTDRGDDDHLSLLSKSTGKNLSE